MPRTVLVAAILKAIPDLRHATGVTIGGIAALSVLCQLPYGSARAQDAISDPSSAAVDFSDPDRQEWLARVAEAKRRARDFALEQRMRSPTSAADLSAEERRLASERVINDSSLQRGDIVSTSRGLFVFRGQPDQDRREGDFVALPRR
jgi:hypothetical protein